MSTTSIVSVIAGLIFLSIIISAISYTRQQAMARRQKQIKKHREQADDIASSVTFLANVDEKYDLLVLLQKQVVAELKSASSLVSDEPKLTAQLTSEANKLATFLEHNRANELKTYCTSDVELSQTRLHLSKINKLLDIFYNRHDVTKIQKQEFVDRIKRLMLDIEVNSHIHQAEDYGEKKDIAMYQLHLKKARDCLKKTSIELTDKNERIKQLSEILKESKSTNKVVASS